MRSAHRVLKTALSPRHYVNLTRLAFQLFLRSLFLGCFFFLFFLTHLILRPMTTTERYSLRLIGNNFSISLMVMIQVLFCLRRHCHDLLMDRRLSLAFSPSFAAGSQPRCLLSSLFTTLTSLLQEMCREH